MANDNNFSEENTAQNSDLIPEVSNNEQAPAPKSPRARRKPKPLVEGINAPVQTLENATVPSLASDSVKTSPDRPEGEPVSMDVNPAPKAGTLSSLGGASAVVPPKITLTNSEKDLIGERSGSASKARPNIFTPSNPQKITLPSRSSSARKFVWSLLISLLAVSLVLGVLFWYNGQTGGSLNQAWNIFPSRDAASDDPSSGEVAGTTETAPEQDPGDAAPVATPATTTPAATAPDTVAETPKQQVTVTATPTGYLNVRSTPSTGGQLLTKVLPGETYTYTETKNGWYHITLADGSTGWVIGQYVQAAK